MLEDFLANVLKELVPIIHLSSYFVSDPWVALATGFYLFIKGACLSHISLNVKYFIQHQNKRPYDVNKVW